jgi:hypothetical protein
MNLFDDLRNKIGRSVAETGQASKRMIELSKLNYKRRDKKREADQIAEEIGWIIFSSWERDRELTLSNALKSGLERLHHAQNELNRIDAEIDNLKNDRLSGFGVMHATANEPASVLIHLCPYCAHQVGEEDRQCGNCRKRYY